MSQETNNGGPVVPAFEKVDAALAESTVPAFDRIDSALAAAVPEGDYYDGGPTPDRADFIQKTVDILAGCLYTPPSQPERNAMADVLWRSFVDDATPIPATRQATPESPKGFDEQSAEDQQAAGERGTTSVLDCIDFGDDDLPRPGKVWDDPNNTD